jgi:aspartyl protease family protein
VSDTVIQALFYGLLLVLPVSALAARRVPVATVMRYAVAWIVIFGVGLLAVRAIT